MRNQNLVLRGLPGFLVALSMACGATESDVAVVTDVLGGTCEFCPLGHFEQHAVINTGKRLKASDELRCLGRAQATARFLSEGGGEFTVKGVTWRLVGFAGLPYEPNELEPTFGEEARAKVPNPTYANIYQNWLNSPAGLTVDTVSPATRAEAGVHWSTNRNVVAELEQAAKTNSSGNFAAQAGITDSTDWSSVLKGEHWVQQVQAPQQQPYPELAIPYINKHISNYKLSREVRTALAKNKGISAKNIMVRAEQGDIVLEGTVPEQSQKTQAAAVAKGVTGVTSVRNALTLRPEGN